VIIDVFITFLSYARLSVFILFSGNGFYLGRQPTAFCTLAFLTDNNKPFIFLELLDEFKREERQKIVVRTNKKQLFFIESLRRKTDFIQ